MPLDERPTNMTADGWFDCRSQCQSHGTQNRTLVIDARNRFSVRYHWAGVLAFAMTEPSSSSIADVFGKMSVHITICEPGSVELLTKMSGFRTLHHRSGHERMASTIS